MQIIRSGTREAPDDARPSGKPRVPGIRTEAIGLLVVSVLGLAGVAQTARRQLAEAEQTAAVNVNAAEPAALAPVLDVFPSDAERTFAATRIIQWIHERHGDGIDRVAAISRVNIPASEIRDNRRR